MGLFLDAANAWLQLADNSYDIIIGHRNSTQRLHLTFHLEDFDHLSGIQHAEDIDFKLPRKKYRGKQLIPALLGGKVDECLLEQSVNWNIIEPRLQAILQLQRVLESDFSIYEFNPHKLSFHTSIKAAYCIFSAECQCGIFLFVDYENDRVYCKSIFILDQRDFLENQTRWTVLKKSVRQKEVEIDLFIHKSYKENFTKTQ